MKTIYHILFSLLFVLAFVGCDDDDDKVIERNQLKLTASAQSVTLTPDATDDEIISFSWNEATSLGADYTFSYLFQIDIADNNFQSATDVRTFGPNESISYSSAELYDLIVEKWGKTAGEAVYVEARVAAKVEGPKFKYPEIATTKVQITTYKPTSQPLYITGTATTGGTDLNAAEKITELSNGRLYNWRGQLKQGGFKFITTLGQALPSYNKGADNSSVVKRTSETEADDLFQINEAGLYYIYLSLKDMTISYKKLLYENLYLVGNATAAGWDIEKIIAMTPDDLNPNIFTYQGALQEGELKILAQRKFDGTTFKPLVENGSIESTDVQVPPGEQPDYKWKITAEQAGLYKITLDTEKMEIKFEKQ